MKAETVNALAGLAVTYEKSNLEVAHELMTLAQQGRPKGPFLAKKLRQYNEKLELTSPEKIELSKLVASGDIAVIPIGFRCHTSMRIKNRLGVDQASLPFDSGFFPPESVASVLTNPTVALSYPDDGATHKVCLKIEDNEDPVHGLGLTFKTSTYDAIDSIVTDMKHPEINQYLDSTFGYYTLDTKHQYVLAHYNWHVRASAAKAFTGSTDIQTNLEVINNMLNKRIARTFEMCKKAKHVFFISGEFQNYNYMQLDDVFHDLNDLSPIEKAVHDTFDSDVTFFDISKLKGPNDLLEIAA